MSARASATMACSPPKACRRRAGEGRAALRRQAPAAFRRPRSSAGLVPLRLIAQAMLSRTEMSAGAPALGTKRPAHSGPRPRALEVLPMIAMRPRRGRSAGNRGRSWSFRPRSDPGNAGQLAPGSTLSETAITQHRPPRRNWCRHSQAWHAALLPAEIGLLHRAGSGGSPHECPRRVRP